MDTKQWMTQLSDHLLDVPLSELAIPGSHNSGTFNLNYRLGVSSVKSPWIRSLSCVPVVGCIIQRWARTQHMDTKAQLDAGIRYFDFRVELRNDSELRLVHGVFAGEVTDALTVIQKFLTEHPKEVVILDFNHFYEMKESHHGILLRQISDTIGNNCVPMPKTEKIYTLREIWELNRNAIVLYNQHVQNHPELNRWSEQHIESLWAQTNTTNALKVYLDKKYAAHKLDVNKFRVWQGVLTPTTRNILKHPCSTLKCILSDRATVAFVEWLNGKTRGPKKINICIVDFIEEHDYIRRVLDLNSAATC